MNSERPPVLTKSFLRLLRYTMVGVSTFLLDLGILYGTVTWLKVPYYVVTPFSFLIAVSLNYLLSRTYVFRGSARGLGMGYGYFAGVAVCAAFVTTGLVTGLVTLFGIYYVFARILVAGLVGMGNYMFNLYVNFKVVGKHDSEIPI